MKGLWKRYGHAWILSYFLIYLIWFFLLNQLTVDDFTPLYVSLDDYFPFVEIFIVPYYLWFPYIPLTIIYFFFKAEKKEYYQLTSFLFIGMTLALITYTIWPNGVYFRPDLDALGRDNIFIELTRFIYAVDPGTNCCPSLHCFNAVGACIGINRCASLKKKKLLRVCVIILTVLICLSTLFVRQHSVIDVFWAFVLAGMMYLLVYVSGERIVCCLALLLGTRAKARGAKGVLGRQERKLLLGTRKGTRQKNGSKEKWESPIGWYARESTRATEHEVEKKF